MSAFPDTFSTRRAPRQPHHSLTQNEQANFAIRLFSNSWATVCLPQGVQAPLIVLKRGPENEGTFEMYWENEPHLLAVALAALGGDINSSLADRRNALEQRVEEGWGDGPAVRCRVEPGCPARLVETFSSYPQMIAILYAEAMIMHKNNLRREIELKNERVIFASAQEGGRRFQARGSRKDDGRDSRLGHMLGSFRNLRRRTGLGRF